MRKPIYVKSLIKLKIVPRLIPVLLCSKLKIVEKSIIGWLVLVHLLRAWTVLAPYFYQNVGLARFLSQGRLILWRSTIVRKVTFVVVHRGFLYQRNTRNGFLMTSCRNRAQFLLVFFTLLYFKLNLLIFLVFFVSQHFFYIFLILIF